MSWVGLYMIDRNLSDSTQGVQQIVALSFQYFVTLVCYSKVLQDLPPPSSSTP